MNVKLIKLYPAILQSSQTLTPELTKCIYYKGDGYFWGYCGKQHPNLQVLKLSDNQCPNVADD